MRFGYMFEGQKGVRSGGSAEKRSADKAVQPAAFVAPHKYICLSSGLHFERASIIRHHLPADWPALAILISLHLGYPARGK